MTTQQGADVRPLIELELYRDAEGLDPRTIPDLASRFAAEGGAAVAAKNAMGRTLWTLPSGLGLGDWVQRLRESGTAVHLFTEPAPVATAKDKAKDKAKVSRTATADEKLSAANGHPPIRPAGGR